MSQAYAADDFKAIRARMTELRRERAEAQVEKMEAAAEGRRIKLHLIPGRKLLKDLVLVRRVRGGNVRIWPPRA